MAAPRKKTTSKGIGRLSEEFTSGQLVTGMVVFLFVSLCLFLAGILVGRIDPSLRDGEEELAGSEAPASPATSSAAEPERNAREPRAASTSTSRYTKPEERGDGPRTTTLKPLAPASSAATPEPEPHRLSRRDAPMVTEELPPPDAMESPEEPEEPRVTTEPEPATEPKAEPAAPKPEPGPDEVPVAPLPEPKQKDPPSAPEAADEEDAVSGGYGIQLAAFGSPNRKTEAEEYQRRLRENADLKARVLTEGAWCKVVLVGYNEEAQARKACAELQEKPAFKDAYVRKLP